MKSLEKLLAHPLFKRKLVVYSRATRVPLYWSRSCVCVYTIIWIDQTKRHKKNSKSKILLRHYVVLFHLTIYHLIFFYRCKVSCFSTNKKNFVKGKTTNGISCAISSDAHCRQLPVSLLGGVCIAK